MPFDGKSSRQNLKRVSEQGELYFLIPTSGDQSVSPSNIPKDKEERLLLLGSINHRLMKDAIIDCIKYKSAGGDERIVLTVRFKTRSLDLFTRFLVQPFKDRQKFVVCNVNLANSESDIDASTINFINKHNGGHKFNVTCGITGGSKWMALWIKKKMIKEILLFGDMPGSIDAYNAFKVKWVSSFHGITGVSRRFARKVFYTEWRI